MKQLQFAFKTALIFALLQLTFSCKKSKKDEILSGANISVTTADVTGVTSAEAISGGTATGSDITSSGICWSESISPTISDNLTVDGSGDGSFVSHITGLQSGKTYNVRAYATNSTGTVYGDSKQFATINRSWKNVYTTQNSNTILYSIFFTSTSTGYVGGSFGTILKTVDGGANWVKQTTGINNAVTSIYFTDVNTGYAASNGIILKTTNGGATWLNIATRYSYFICFKDATTGIIANLAGIIQRTTDGGSTWTIVYNDLSGTVGNLTSATFVSPLVGFVTSDLGDVLKTVDGGASWTRTQIPASNGTNQDRLYNISFGNPTTGFLTLADVNGVFACKTIDAGLHWVKQATSVPTNIDFLDASNAFGVYLDDGGTPNPNVYKSTNSGLTWTVHSTLPLNTFFPNSITSKVHFINSDLGFALTDNHIFKYE